MKGNRGKAVLTDGAVGALLVKLTIPMIFGILGMVIYNLVDTFFVGRLGKDQLAALSFTFPVVLIIGSISHGLGIGTSALVSRAIGENDYKRVKRLATDSIVLSLLVVASFVTLGLLTIDPLFRLLGAGDRIIPYIREYMSVWYFGMIFVVVPMVGNNIIRATGDSKTPGVIMMIGALLNGILDPVLIFGSSAIPVLGSVTAYLGFEIPPFGIRGAAAATLIGRSITFFVAIYVLTIRERVISLKKPRFREILDSWKEILAIGIPNTGTRMIIPIGAGVITRIISSEGVLAVAGYGIATRIEFFSLAAVNALSSIIGPFVGQNLGAGKLERVREGIKKGNMMSVILGGFFFTLLFFLSGRIASVFSSDPFIISTASLYLRIVSAAYGFQGIYLISVPILNVFKKPFIASFLSIIEVFILIIPLAFIGGKFFDIPGIFTAIGVSYMLTGLISAYIVSKKTENI